MTQKPLWPHQADILQRIRSSVSSGSKAPLVQSIMGSGKTRMFSELCKAANVKGNASLVIAPRRELIDQAAQSLVDEGLEVGIIMAGRAAPKKKPDVWVASFDTMHARTIRASKIDIPDVAVVHIDEAHLSIADGRQKVLAQFPDALRVGWTATPARSDGRGMSELYDDLIIGPKPQDLIDQGMLVQPRYFVAPKTLDVSKLEFNSSEYTQEALEKASKSPELQGDVVDNWRRVASGRPTIVFACTINHSISLAADFVRAGIRARHLDAYATAAERAHIFQQMKEGKIDVLTQVFLATYGLDIPRISCVVLARPIRNVVTYDQSVGRGLRACVDKSDCLVLDHAGCIAENGFIEEGRPWSLDSDTTVRERQERKRKEEKEPKEITCVSCKSVFKMSRRCPECGHEMVRQGEPIPVWEADLEEIARDKRRLNTKTDLEVKQEIYSQLADIAERRGYRKGWISHKYRSKFGVWPVGKVRTGPKFSYEREYDPDVIALAGINQ